SEVAVGRGVGGRDVVDAAGGIVIDRPLDHTENILTIDPRHPVASGAHGAARSEPERKEEFGEGTTVSGEDDAEAEDDDAGEWLGSGGQFLPPPRDLGEKPRSCSGALVELFICAITVNADRRRADERAVVV